MAAEPMAAEKAGCSEAVATLVAEAEVREVGDTLRRVMADPVRESAQA